MTKFLTLTLDPKKIEGDSVRYLRKVFNKFRVYLLREYKAPIKYIAVLEFHKSGIAHLHVLIDRYIRQQWISKTWSAVGGGYIVDIKFVDVHRISHYLSKYLTKELLLSAPDRSRRVTTSRSIHLIQKKPTELVWRVTDLSIFHWYSIYSTIAKEAAADEQGFLFSFLIQLNGTTGPENTTLTLEVWTYGGTAVLFVW